jgi:CRISPR-associated helicase Cas3/CRISPR-associated endonuclease Cas3-HD
MSASVQYLAHSANGGETGVVETLRDHLLAVARRAGGFADAFGAGEQAYAAGLLHDLGKYADRFLRRILGDRRPAGDHWTVGALLAVTLAGELGLLPALAIEGHHAGLTELPPLPSDFRRTRSNRMKSDPNAFTEHNYALLLDRFKADGLAVPAIHSGLQRGDHHVADLLDARMLFSALVDADFLETEAHFEGDARQPRRPRLEGPTLAIDPAITALESYRGSVQQRHAGSPLATLRDSLYQACVDAAAGSQGLFTLAAPTGAGKTLAMLAFALYHARRHGLRRIVLVMPFLNIIDQTARIYRDVFSPDRGFHPLAVLEHHSLREHDDETDNGDRSRARLLTENWDAPLVLTTNVQMLESLMSNRPSACRKLHRLSQSVILFDEVQTLPPPLAVATLATLSRLTDPAGPYRSTAVFATATQPAFDALDARIALQFASAGWKPREMVSDAAPYYAQAAVRVRVSWRHSEAIGLDELADELAMRERVLCIVNLKRHAIELAETLRKRQGKGLYHLSTNMCPAHRTKVLQQVNKRLAAGKSVRLVATQCVEAGVEIDFPVVYRAFAPLEAIAQAAGRCNRHGVGPPGQVVVFKPRDDRSLYPPGYKAAVGATETFLNLVAAEGNLDTLEIINDPGRLRAYFRLLYSLSGRAADEIDDERELLDAIRAGDFAEIAKLYRLIDQDAINVVVPYDTDEFTALRDAVADGARLKADEVRRWRHRAARHTVSLYRPKPKDPVWNLIEPVLFGRQREGEQADWFVALATLEYDGLTGLSASTEMAWIA